MRLFRCTFSFRALAYKLPCRASEVISKQCYIFVFALGYIFCLCSLSCSCAVCLWILLRRCANRMLVLLTLFNLFPCFSSLVKDGGPSACPANYGGPGCYATTNSIYNVCSGNPRCCCTNNGACCDSYGRYRPSSGVMLPCSNTASAAQFFLKLRRRRGCKLPVFRLFLVPTFILVS